MLRALCFIVARDPVVIERSNLVNISKLIVKELIEQSLRYGRMLDSDHLPLHHFFIVLEHVMRHGLKPKKVGKMFNRITQITVTSDLLDFERALRCRRVLCFYTYIDSYRRSQRHKLKKTVILSR